MVKHYGFAWGAAVLGHGFVAVPAGTVDFTYRDISGSIKTAVSSWSFKGLASRPTPGYSPTVNSTQHAA